MRPLAASRPNGLTTLVALIVIGVIPSALGSPIASQRTMMLEVRALTHDPRVGVECEDNAPPAILIRVTRDEVIVGEELRTPRRIRAVTALHRQLRRLKDERPERQRVIVQVDDYVSHERLVSILDMLADVELQAIDLDVR